MIKNIIMKKKSILNLIVCFIICSQSIFSQQYRVNQREVKTYHLDEINMSDPFVLADNNTKTYYMTGTGGLMYKSKDLRMWEGPYNIIEIDTTSWMGSHPMIWAAELHEYNGKYYYFATFTNREIIIDDVQKRSVIPRRASHILYSENPEGPYRPMNDKFYLPEKWATLDGTLWIEDGTPYMIFCHEWLQIIDGTMDMIELSKDLSESVGEPVTLFRASEGPWVQEMTSIGEKTNGKIIPGWVTDGPYLFKTKNNRLGMIWSSWGSNRYAQGVVYSESGKLSGPWIHQEKPLNPDNAGHGMLFRTFEGKLLMSLHYQDLEKERSPRKPMFYEIDDSGNEIKIGKRFNP
jgi:GH43 family beta-xylosidase